MLQVQNFEACWQAILDLLDDPGRSRALAIEAQSQLARQPDVLQTYLEALTPYL
jgi:hypothetical protein